MTHVARVAHRGRRRGRWQGRGSRARDVLGGISVIAVTARIELPTSIVELAGIVAARIGGSPDVLQTVYGRRAGAAARTRGVAVIDVEAGVERVGDCHVGPWFRIDARGRDA